jgi:hypothetical protein
MDPENLPSVFTRPEPRSVRQHTISLDGRTWTCPELDAYFGDKVIARMPVYHGFNELLVEDPKGQPDRHCSAAGGICLPRSARCAAVGRPGKGAQFCAPHVGQVGTRHRHRHAPGRARRRADASAS